MSWNSSYPKFRSIDELVNVNTAYSRKRKSSRHPPENQCESEGRSEPDPIGHHSPPLKQMEQGPSANPNADTEIKLSPILEVEPDAEVPEKEDDARRTTTNPSSSDGGAPPFNFPEINGDFDCASAIETWLVNLPPNVTVPAVFAFGDSIVNQGMNNHLATLVKCNFPPYGKDLYNVVPTGRFSNGKTPPDFIAEELGVKELIPAYLDPNLKPQDLPTGVSFASGGCGFDPQTALIVSAIPLSDQLNHFKEYIGKLKAAVGEEKGNFILANSLYLELYNLGARRIAVFGTPPIGCLPAQRTLAGGIARMCSEEENQAAQLVNDKLSPALTSLTKRLPQSKIVYINIYDPLLDLIQHPHNHG
ncbi:hypothetical protein SASPL_113071 [Salvia splendens]|uniref:GDSL esterase/lipase n=1 Tax=Salvia splendens TaxID=180675 RepID=A0A8X8XYV3_SALSN|nr:hypothetical protein SASPL_113071 [Salvia splendens]